MGRKGLCILLHPKCLVENNPIKHAAGSLWRVNMRICVEQIGCSVVSLEA